LFVREERSDGRIIFCCAEKQCWAERGETLAVQVGLGETRGLDRLAGFFATLGWVTRVRSEEEEMSPCKSGRNRCLRCFFVEMKDLDLEDRTFAGNAVNQVMEILRYYSDESDLHGYYFYSEVKCPEVRLFFFHILVALEIFAPLYILLCDSFSLLQMHPDGSRIAHWPLVQPSISHVHHSLALISSYLELATSLRLPCVQPHQSYRPASVSSADTTFRMTPTLQSTMPCKATLTGHQLPPSWQHAGRPRQTMPGYPSCPRSAV
jgi:hypothetical protein